VSESEAQISHPPRCASKSIGPFDHSVVTFDGAMVFETQMAMRGVTSCLAGRRSSLSTWQRYGRTTSTDSTHCDPFSTPPLPLCRWSAGRSGLRLKSSKQMPSLHAVPGDVRAQQARRRPPSVSSPPPWTGCSTEIPGIGEQLGRGPYRTLTRPPATSYRCRYPIAQRAYGSNLPTSCAAHESLSQALCARRSPPARAYTFDVVEARACGEPICLHLRRTSRCSAVSAVRQASSSATR